MSDLIMQIARDKWRELIMQEREKSSEEKEFLEAFVHWRIAIPRDEEFLAQDELYKVMEEQGYY